MKILVNIRKKDWMNDKEDEWKKNKKIKKEA